MVGFSRWMKAALRTLLLRGGGGKCFRVFCGIWILEKFVRFFRNFFVQFFNRWAFLALEKFVFEPRFFFSVAELRKNVRNWHCNCPRAFRSASGLPVTRPKPPPNTSGDKSRQTPATAPKCQVPGDAWPGPSGDATATQMIIKRMVGLYPDAIRTESRGLEASPPLSPTGDDFCGLPCCRLAHSIGRTAVFGAGRPP